MAEPFNLDYVINFYKPKKEPCFAVFTIKILVAKCLVAIRQLIKVLPDSLPCVNECATMPSVNSVTKST